MWAGGMWAGGVRPGGGCAAGGRAAGGCADGRWAGWSAGGGGDGMQWWLNHEQRMNWDMIPELNQQYKWGFMGFTCGP